MERRSLVGLALVLSLTLSLALIPACSDDDRATKPADASPEHLAGGGRDQGDDPFVGGPEGSGPARPDFEYPESEYLTLFYAETDCSGSPSNRVIWNQADWEAWWVVATACLPGGGAGPDSMHPYPDAPPVLDFEQNVVVAISLAPDENPWRGLWVTDVVQSEAGTTVEYQVSNLGEDCYGDRDSLETVTTSPTIAILVPRPVTEPVRWEGTELIFDCSWEPDPDMPLAVYYTDADCDLGTGEVVIREPDEFEAWLSQALACDQVRWGELDSTWTEPGVRPSPRHWFPEGDRDSVPVEPAPPPSPWIGIEIDFTTHAVLILRADPQSRWGGGIWLDAISSTSAGTVIDYTIMEPTADCPPVDGADLLRPTVAIRVPLPVVEPVTWNRHVESIECGWRDGEPGTGTGPDSIPPPRPF